MNTVYCTLGLIAVAVFIGPLAAVLALSLMILAGGYE